MSNTNDPFNLQRFVEAQDPVIDDVKQELRSGQKQSHWMWYIFPQIAGLGRSEMAHQYAIASCEEGDAYLTHPVLGPRLRECTELVNAINGHSANDVFGSPDDLKFRSSMTLFENVSNDSDPFYTALTKYYDGDRDQKTLARLE